MPTSPRVRLFSSTLLLVLTVAQPALAAAPGGTGLERFGAATLEFLAGTLGPLVLGIGLALVAYSLIFGSRDGLQKALFVIVGGVMLFSVDSIVSFISSSSR